MAINIIVVVLIFKWNTCQKISWIGWSFINFILRSGNFSIKTWNSNLENFQYVSLKMNFWIIWTVVLSREDISSSKWGYLLKCSVSSLFYGLLSESVKLFFSETSPSFPCRLISFSSLLFIFHCQSPIYKFYKHYLQMYTNRPI